MEELDRHTAIEQRVERLEDGSHSPRGRVAHQPISATDGGRIRMYSVLPALASSAWIEPRLRLVIAGRLGVLGVHPHESTQANELHLLSRIDDPFPEARLSASPGDFR
jgi:hypothetical protein